MKRLTKEEFETLENYVDRYRVEGVLLALAEVCYCKAEHLDSNWQDTSTARIWERMARAVEKCEGKARELNL